MVFDEGFKLIKQIGSIVGARTCFGMVLHRKTGLILKGYPGNGLIVEMLVGYVDIGMFFDFLSFDSKSVILRSYFSLACF